jgi:hypothetical protein
MLSCPPEVFHHTTTGTSPTRGLEVARGIMGMSTRSLRYGVSIGWIIDRAYQPVGQEDIAPHGAEYDTGLCISVIVMCPIPAVCVSRYEVGKGDTRRVNARQFVGNQVRFGGFGWSGGWHLVARRVTDLVFGSAGLLAAERGDGAGAGEQAAGAEPLVAHPGRVVREVAQCRPGRLLAAESRPGSRSPPPPARRRSPATGQPLQPAVPSRRTPLPGGPTRSPLWSPASYGTIVT